MSATADAERSTLRATPGWHRYFIARCISAGGSALTWIALPVLAYQLTGSSLWTAVVVAFDAVPYLLLGLAAGRTADLRDRKLVVVASDVLSGVALLSLLAADSLGTLSPWHLVVVAFLVQSCFVFGDAAHLGGLPTLVGADLVMAANSRLYGYIGILECIVPALGGLALSQVSPVALLTADAVTFLACAAVIASLPTALSPSREERRRNASESMWRGLSYLWSHSLLRDLTLANLVICIGNGALFATLVVWADEAHDIQAGDVRLGLLYTGLSIGGVVGAFCVERIADLGPPRHVIGIASAVGGLTGLGAVWVSSALVACALFALSSAATFSAMVIGVSIRQSRSPKHLVGMINTTGRMLALGIGFPVGALGGAAIGRATDSSAIGISVGLALLALIWPLLAGVRDERLDASVPETSPQ